MSYTVDLHSHSYGSLDGGLKLRDYRYFLENGLLDYIAITDHNRIDTAQKIQTALDDLGNRIIVGEEILTTEGEIIGLYLKEAVPIHLSPLETAQAIHAQGGLVYIPHPYETVRSGLSQAALDAIAQEVDIIETWNGRAIFQNRSRQARKWAGEHEISSAASSDAHGRFGWGYTYSVVGDMPTAKNLPKLLHQAEYSTRTVGMGILYPKLNRLRKSFGGAK